MKIPTPEKTVMLVAVLAAALPTTSAFA